MNGSQVGGRPTHTRSWRSRLRGPSLVIAAGASLVVLHAVFGFGAGPAIGSDTEFERRGRVAPARQSAAAARHDAVRLSAVTLLSDRASAMDSMWLEVERFYEDEVGPVERILALYRDDPELVRNIAVALVREAHHAGVEPWLLLAVLLVENAQLDTSATSIVGARGLMQVMPFHLGHWPECAPDLDDVDANICHGARIFAHYFREERGDIERALLRYNGCVRGTITPNCQDYPYHVFARAGRASVITWMQSLPPFGDMP